MLSTDTGFTSGFSVLSFKIFFGFLKWLDTFKIFFGFLKWLDTLAVGQLAGLGVNSLVVEAVSLIFASYWAS